MSIVSNPILPGCYPDPSVCRVGDDYYLVNSTFEYFPGLPVFHSKDLVNWRQIGSAVERAGQLDLDGLVSSSGLYAPTIRHHDGVFWIVCTVVDLGTEGPSFNFVMTATDPAGPWSDPIRLDVDGCDPSMLFDDDGRVWMHGMRIPTEKAWPEQTEIWLREFDPATMALVGPEQIIWTGALVGATWAEGPHLYKVDGRYYLLAAEAGTHFFHAVTVARADTVIGPYVGYAGNPVLTHRHLGRGSDIVGVGHAELVQATDGSWWAFHLAMRPYGGYHYNLGRETFLTPVVWEDGWPVFAPGTGRVPAQLDVPWLTGEPTSQARSGVIGPDDPRWTALRRPIAEFAAPEGEGWRLTMRPSTLAEPVTPAFLGVRQQHRRTRVAATLRADPQPGEELGIAVRQSENDHLRLTVTPGGAPGQLLARAVHRRDGSDALLGQVTVPPGPVEFAVLARDQEYALLVGPPGTDLTVVARADGAPLCSVCAGGFLGVWIGVYATSNGNPTETVVRVDRFEYESLD